MARRARLLLAGIPHHLLQRGNNRQPVFFSDQDYRRCLARMLEAARKYDCRVYAYVLMPNHFHLLASGTTSPSLSHMMGHIDGYYSRYFNRIYQRSGPLWDGRFKANAIEPAAWLLRCCRYVECNPVRERIVAHPRDYQWSSYRFHAEGAPDALGSMHEEFERLGSTPEERQRVYREFCGQKASAAEAPEIRDALNHEWPLGGERFKDEIENASHRPVRPSRRGRPPKPLS
jgi:putative transposase